jgi:ribosomal protein S18 acetylase RimI-like enzyme
MTASWPGKCDATNLMQTVQALELIPVHNKAQIATVVRLAGEIWPEHYLSIIGQAQVDYMLARFQSDAAITEQLQSGYEYFLLKREQQNLGYAAVRIEHDLLSLFVSKLYLLRAVRGQGLGRAAMNELAQLAEARGVRKLWLTVNKHNPARFAYLRIGFVTVAEVVADIGAGYVMDDYKMEWTLASDSNL